MAIINGIPVNFAFQGAADANFNSGITTTGLSGVLLQNADVTGEAEVEVVRDGQGDQVMHGWYDLHKSCTLEYIVTGTNLAGAITNTVLIPIGTFISITACISIPALIGTNWEVQKGGKISGSNTTAKKISVPLMLCPKITAIAT